MQEEGAQLVASCVTAVPNDKVADLCAGHGGKTVFLSASHAGLGPITAIDVDESKLDHLRAEFERLHLSSETLRCEAIDLSKGLGGLGAEFDRVLLDAPCTGIGTLHRRPELLLRLTPDDPARMAALQLSIATKALHLLRPGGEMFYAVCSPLAEEGFAVVRALLEAAPSLEQLDPSLPDLSLAADRDRILRIGPWSGPSETYPDAYQVARFRRRG